MGRLGERLSERLVRAGACETATSAYETAAGASEVQRQCKATVRQSKEKHHDPIETQRVHSDMGRLGKRISMRLVLHCTALHCTALHCTALHCASAKTSST